MATHSSILAWRIGQRILKGCSPWGHEESDTTNTVRVTNTFTSNKVRLFLRRICGINAYLFPMLDTKIIISYKAMKP